MRDEVDVKGMDASKNVTGDALDWGGGALRGIVDLAAF